MRTLLVTGILGLMAGIVLTHFYATEGLIVFVAAECALLLGLKLTYRTIADTSKYGPPTVIRTRTTDPAVRAYAQYLTPVEPDLSTNAAGERT